MFATIYRKKNKDEWMVIQNARVVGDENVRRELFPGEPLRVLGFEDNAITEWDVAYHGEGSVEIVRELRKCKDRFLDLTSRDFKCGLALQAFGYKSRATMPRHAVQMDLRAEGGVIALGGDSCSLEITVSMPWRRIPPKSGNEEWDTAMKHEVHSQIWIEIQQAFSLAISYDSVKKTISTGDESTGR